MSDSYAQQPAPSAADHAGGSVLAGRPDAMSADVFVEVLLRSASEGIAVSERESGRFVVVSDSYCELTGYARNELLGRTSVELGLVADHAVRSEALSQAGQDRSGVSQLRIRRKDGEIRLFEFSAQLLPDGLMLTISRDVTESRRIEAQLRESEERFRRLAENARDVIRLYDAEAMIRYASPSCETVLGFAPDELVGHHSTEFQHPDDVAIREGRQQDILAADDELTVTYRSRHKDGRYVWLESSVRVLRNEAGDTVTGFQETARDITERKQAEQTLRAAEERYRELFENSPSGVVKTTLDGKLIDANPAYAALLGYDSVEQLLADGPTVAGLYENASNRDALFKTVRGQGGVRELEARLRRRDGSWVWVAADLKVTMDADGVPTGWQGAMTDITARKEAEEALRESEERFRLLADNATDMITRSSPDTILLYVSPASRELYGYEPEEMVGHRLREWIHPDDLNMVGRVARSIRVPGKHAHTIEYRARRKDGTYVWVESKIRTLWDPVTGEAAGFRNATRDISERKAAELEIQRAREEAERANLAKSDFLSRMSHELRTPLNAILGFGQLLERAPLPERQHRHAEHVTKAGRHLLTLIDEVLEISRIESGSLGISVEPVPLATSVQDALELIQPIADQRDILVETDLSTPAGLHVMADAQRLKQVLLNLLSNAVKYNHPCGRIRVLASLEGDNLLLRVSDTGPGIATEDLPRLFTPFDRIGAEASDVEGTGLGLALSRRLAEAMGGSLNATSEIGTGSTFELRLAYGEPKPAAPDFTAPPKARQGLPSCRVLYVEDNISNLRLVEEILADDDVEIIAAATGRLALDIAPGAKADVILLDINLPDMTGEEVLRELRTSPQTVTTPVIILTADATPTTHRRMLELGANAHLTKPIDIVLLKTTLADNTTLP